MGDFPENAEEAPLTLGSRAGFGACLVAEKYVL